jgi:co-chaperonin GroES (HSP10)
MNQGSKTRILAKILGGQNTANEKEAKSAGGIILGEAEKEKGADYGKLAIIHAISDDTGPLKVGYYITISARSGRSVIKDVDGSSLYVLNQDEVWAYNPEYVPTQRKLSRTPPVQIKKVVLS